MNNYQNASVGKRIKLLKPMENIGSNLIAIENVPVGTEGTILHVSICGSKFCDQITVRWDNGKTLGLFPYQDSYEVL